MEVPDDELDALERQLRAGKWDMRELEEYLESSPPESPPEKRRHLEERSASPAVHRPTSPIRAATPTRRSRSRSPSRYASRSPARSPTRSRLSRSPMRTREGKANDIVLINGSSKCDLEVTLEGQENFKL